MRKTIFLAFVSLLALSCTGLGSAGGGTSTVQYDPVTGATPGAESIVGASIASPAARGIVNRFDHSIHFYLPAGSDLSALTPSFALAAGVSVSSPAGAQDLSAAKTYTLSDGSSYTVQAFNTVPSAATVNAWLGTGINLGNDLDAWPEGTAVWTKDPEGSWTNGVVAQKYFFDDYKRMGFDSVRIPITWGPSGSTRIGAASSYTIDTAFLARAKQLAGWALDAGLTVVINAHHEDWIRTKTGSELTNQIPRFQAIWTQIAAAFKDWPPQLVFEILNEPHDSITNAEVSNLNATILNNAIRPTNPTRVVIVGSNSWNSKDSLVASDFALPGDSANGGPHLIATFHNYNPWSFAGQSSGTWGSAADKSAMANDFAKIAAWSANHANIPVYMGEYGVTFVYNGARTNLDSRAAWYSYVYQAARAKGFSMAIWDDFGDFKIYDRSRRSYDASVVPTVVAH